MGLLLKSVNDEKGLRHLCQLLFRPTLRTLSTFSQNKPIIDPQGDIEESKVYIRNQKQAQSGQTKYVLSEGLVITPFNILYHVDFLLGIVRAHPWDRETDLVDLGDKRRKFSTSQLVEDVIKPIYSHLQCLEGEQYIDIVRNIEKIKERSEHERGKKFMTPFIRLNDSGQLDSIEVTKVDGMKNKNVIIKFGDNMSFSFCTRWLPLLPHESAEDAENLSYLTKEDAYNVYEALNDKALIEDLTKLNLDEASNKKFNFLVSNFRDIYLSYTGKRPVFLINKQNTPVNK